MFFFDRLAPGSLTVARMVGRELAILPVGPMPVMEMPPVR
jgi:hypothetical protein